MAVKKVSRLRAMSRVPDPLKQMLGRQGFDQIGLATSNSELSYELYAYWERGRARAIGVFSIVDDEALVTRAFVHLPGINEAAALQLLLAVAGRRFKQRWPRLTYFVFVTDQVMIWRMACQFTAGLCYPHPHHSDPPRVASLRGSVPRRLGITACGNGNPAKAWLPKTNGTSRLSVGVLRDWWKDYADSASLVCVGTFQHTS